MRLLPREEKFFQSFVAQADVILEAAQVLLEGVSSGHAGMASAAARIRTLEQKGDELIHETYTSLNSTFITPLDPEDIHSLASDLDNVLDGIEDAAHRLVAYRLPEIPPMVVELARIVLSCAKAIQRAFKALSAKEEVLEQCIEINRLEEVADQLVRDAVSDLFANEKDPILLMKLKEVYEFLESTTDSCEDVADALQNVAVKNV